MFSKENNRAEQFQEDVAMSVHEACASSGDALYLRHLDITQPRNLLEDALNEYARALELNPDCPAVLAKIAKISLRQGNYLKAEQLARKAMEKNPRLKDAHFVLGYIRYKEEAYPESLKSLGKAIACDPLRASRARFCLFYACQEMARHAKNPFVSLWMWTVGFFNLVLGFALIRMEPDRYRFGQILSAVPGILKAYWCERGQNTLGALEEYQRLVRRFPGLPPILNVLSRLYRQQGREEEAFYWLQRSVERDPVYEEGFFQLGQYYEERGEAENAIAMYSHLLTLRPKNPHVHCSLGNLYYKNNAPDEAVSHYKAALQLSDNPAWRALLAQSLGNIYQEIYQDREAAQMAFQMALDLNPADVDNYVNLGVLYFEKGDCGNAQLIYEKALVVDPDNARLHSNLGYLKWMRGEIPDAVRLYERAIELDPTYDIPLNNLGVIQLDAVGDVSRAIHLLERAIALNERYALAHYNLGRAHSLLNNKIEAASSFQKAQELNEYTRELDTEDLKARINNLFNS